GRSVPLLLLEAGERSPQNDLLLEAKRIDFAEVLGLRRLGLLFEQGLGGIRRAAVESGMALPQLRREALTLDHDLVRESLGRTKPRIVGWAFEVVHVLDTQGPGSRDKGDVGGTRLGQPACKLFAPGIGHAGLGGEMRPKQVAVVR